MNEHDLASTLLLVPTQTEKEILVSHPGLAGLLESGLNAEICGFGLLAATILASRLIAYHNPEKIILAGIAGALSPEWELGTAVEFGHVTMTGIGVGSGLEHKSVEQMGWDPFQGQISISETLKLGWEEAVVDLTGSPLPTLLTVSSASSSLAERNDRVGKFPQAAAEDMEGYAVAAAAASAGIPLRILRGVSNYAGNRDKHVWKTTEALTNVADRICGCFESQ